MNPTPKALIAQYSGVRLVGVSIVSAQKCPVCKREMKPNGLRWVCVNPECSEVNKLIYTGVIPTTKETMKVVVCTGVVPMSEGCTRE